MSKALSSLAVGTKIEVPVLSAYQSRFGAKIVFKIADKNHSGYPANSVTLIAEKIIQLMCSDAKEPSNSNSDRKNYGNNRHIHSNILQWLNSNATAGKWYSAKHGQDAPPTNANVWDNKNEYDAWAGFLAMLDPKFVAELLNTTLTVVKSLTDGGSYETFAAKMFLASTTEVGLANENGIAEGSRLALFSNDASRVAYPTAECVKNSEYTSGSLNTSSGWYWWLRTPDSSSAYVVRNVVSDGTLNGGLARIGNGGVRPLCNLKSSILVSDNPNSSGNYEIINSFVISLSEPLEANRQPTRCNIKVNRDIPAGGTFKVEACNNPYDVAPIWEDCTNAVIAGLAHVFKNKTNTAVQFGLNIRVTVERGDALTACWVSGIGGNFE